MDAEETVEELNVHADLNERMMALYGVVTEYETLPYDAMITLLQAAFWAGVEAVCDDAFCEAVIEISNDAE